MSLKEKYNTYLRVLASKLGTQSTILNENGETRLSVSYKDTELDVMILVFEVQQIVTLTSPIYQLTVKDDALASMLIALFSANLFGVMTNGLSLSWSPRDTTVYLGYTIFPHGNEYELFELAMTRLIVAGVEWKAKLCQQLDFRP